MKVGLDSHSPLAAQISHESSRFSQPAAVGGWVGGCCSRDPAQLGQLAGLQGGRAGQGRVLGPAGSSAKGSPSRRPTFCVCCSTRTGFSPPVAKWPTWIHLAGRTRQTNEHSGGPRQGSTAGDDDTGQHGPAAARRAGARRGIACRQPAARGAGAPPQAGAHLGADHLTPLMTGQAVCRLRLSSSPLGLMLWNSTASPFLGLAAR